MNSADVRAAQAAAKAACIARKASGAHAPIRPQKCSRCMGKGIEDFGHSAANHACPSR